MNPYRDLSIEQAQERQADLDRRYDMAIDYIAGILADRRALQDRIYELTREGLHDANLDND